jgi:D-glycero-alpha-D-manno-heptose-7-phosphate kinase
MIISKTPFRISFAGGGTDLPVFYQHEPGAVTSSTIDRYMFITVNKRFDSSVRISYSKTEIVDSAHLIHHPIIREVLLMLGLTNGIEITSIADIPAGTGMGSSSSFTVGLLNALHAYQGHCASAEQLAQEACRIEIELLKEPIGKQDQYAAAYGGLNHIQFNPDETVFVNPVIGRFEAREELSENLLLFYTGITRSASKILAKQQEDTTSKLDVLQRMREISRQLAKVLQSSGRLSEFGELLHEAWLLKRQITSGISNPDIDRWYETARQAGALGGKLLGAGGGGFFLLYVERQNQKYVRESLHELKELPFSLEPQGSKIIYVGD